MLRVILFFFCEYGEDGKHTEIGSVSFLKQLEACDYKQILIYIQGFSK